jgi:hypothetical protein
MAAEKTSKSKGSQSHFLEVGKSIQLYLLWLESAAKTSDGRLAAAVRKWRTTCGRIMNSSPKKLKSKPVIERGGRAGR